MNESCVVDIMRSAGWRIESLRGPRAKAARQKLMLGLTGELLPATKCGINPLVEKMIAVLGIDESGKCRAAVISEIERTIIAIGSTK